MSGPSRFVREAIQRRIDAGLCPVCGGKMIKPQLLRMGKQEPAPVCVNNDDGRHGGGGRRIRLK